MFKNINKLYLSLNNTFLWNNYYKNMKKIEIIKKITNNGLFIRNIQNPDEELQLLAVKNNASAIKYIKNLDKDIQLAAVISSGKDIIKRYKNLTSWVNVILNIIVPFLICYKHL